MRNAECTACSKRNMGHPDIGVILYLLKNELKLTPVGGDIIIHLLEKPFLVTRYTTYEFSIKDTGIGMSPEFVGHVFDTFARVQSSTVSGIQGTGLGMAITKNIVEMMGGTIAVESEDGKGSKFTATITVRFASQPIKYAPIAELQGHLWRMMILMPAAVSARCSEALICSRTGRYPARKLFFAHRMQLS